MSGDWKGDKVAKRCTINSICDSIDNGAHGVMFEVRARTELVVDAVWVASAWKGKYSVTIHCTNEERGKRAWPLPPKLPPRKKLVELSVNEVSSLMDSLQLTKYRNKWENIPINGAKLASLIDFDNTEAKHDNLKEYGVLFEGHRNKILEKIQEFKMHGVPSDIIRQHGALDKNEEKSGNWMKCGYATLSEPKRLMKVMLSKRILLKPGSTQAFYIHSPDGYGSAIGYSSQTLWKSADNNDIQILSGPITRSEEPFQDLKPWRHCFTGRLDYGITQRALKESGAAPDSAYDDL